MRVFFALVLMASVLGVARAGDRATLRLNPSPDWRLEATVQRKREREIWGEQIEYIHIEGHVINDTAHERVAPKIRIAVIDADGREMYHWTVQADEPRVKPRQRVAFSSRLESPPGDTVSVELQTVEAK